MNLQHGPMLIVLRSLAFDRGLDYYKLSTHEPSIVGVKVVQAAGIALWDLVEMSVQFTKFTSKWRSTSQPPTRSDTCMLAMYGYAEALVKL